jgi:hypothetical protein
MWEECLRRALHDIASSIPGGGLNSRAEVFFWVGRELVWWWLVVGLAAFLWLFLRRSLRSETFGRSPAPSPA